MKKTLALLMALALGTSMLLVGCGDKKDASDNKETVKKEAATAVADVTAKAEKSDNSDVDKNILGKWEYESGGFIYNFKKDGTGTYDISGTVQKFTYTTKDGKITITYEGEDTGMELEYEVDGDTLNVKDSFGEDTIYKKK